MRRQRRKTILLCNFATDKSDKHVNPLKIVRFKYVTLLLLAYKTA